jgi:hypothetical protein
MTHTVENFFNLQTLIQPFNFLLNLGGNTSFTRLLTAGFAALCLVAPFFIPAWRAEGTWKLKIDGWKSHLFSAILGISGISLIATALISDRLGFGGPPGIGLKQSLVIYLGIASLAGARLVNTNLMEVLRARLKPYDWSWWKSRAGYGFLLLFAGSVCHLLGIIVLSFATPFSKLEDRLLAPALTLLLLAFLVGFQYIMELTSSSRLRIGLVDLVFVLALVSPGILKEGVLPQASFNFPVEQQLWQALNTYPGISKVSHFYSDTDFTHQIYAQRPQRLIADEASLEQDGFLDSLMAKGTCPFVVVEAGSPLSQLMKQVYQGSGLTRYEMIGGSFELYARDCLFTP